jgi:hypothetical protein
MLSCDFHAPIDPRPQAGMCEMRVAYDTPPIYAHMHTHTDTGSCQSPLPLV